LDLKSLLACSTQPNEVNFSYANFDAFMNRAFSTHSRFNSLHVRCAPKLGNFYNAVHSIIAHDKEAFLMKNTGHTLAE
jgi:hypothetical protein